MEIKSIDVSSYQGKPDWAKVKKAGINFAILRIHQKNGPDTSFEHNYKGCRANKIAVGGYKYSYALTEAQALKEAEETLAVLDGRELDLPVFYDLEWEKQRKLGKEAVEKIAVVFLDHIKKAGYRVGIYCNVDWYQNVLSTKLKSYDLWLARYPANDDGTVQTRLKPEQGIGWQYSSKGKVAGISGNVDMDLFYKDYKEKAEEKKKTTGNKLEKHIKLGNYYANYGGKKPYLEKKSNAYLDDFTRNAGSKNYTKFARDVNNWGQPGCQGQPWCAVYQFWKLVKIFGLARALQIMGGGFYNCRSVTRHAKQKGTWHSTPKKAIDGYVWIDYGTASDQRSTETAIHLDKTPKWVGMVNTAELNVRSWAGTEYPRIKKYPLLAQHNLVDVCNTIKADDGTAWYYVRIVNKYYGFVAARYIAKV